MVKALSFILIFLVAVFILSGSMSRVNTTTTSVMDDASLPVVSVLYNGAATNTMHGLLYEPDLSMYRADLSPLGEGRKLSVSVKKYGTTVTGLRMEVRSADGSRLIEEQDIYDYNDQDDSLVADIYLKDLIEPKTEYSLCIVLTLSGGKQVRYYTRVLSDDSLHTPDMISFVNNFSILTMDKDSASVISPYLESDASGDNSNFGHVNIHSSFQQITWGDLKPSRVTDASIRILDMYGDIGAFILNYRMICGVDNKDSVYEINEYYRVRYSDERMYLLDFERQMDELFTAGKSSFANDKIILGIYGENVDIVENNTGSAIAFVANGSLFSYRQEGARAVKVFSFLDEDNDDERTRYDGHSIKILSVDEGGNIRFLVYGYQNRGPHEGEICAVVYYYDCGVNTVEEEVSVPYRGSSQMLEANIRRLSYVDRVGNFYLYLDGSIYRINVAAKSVETLASGIAFDQTASSESGMIGAYIINENMGAGEDLGSSSASPGLTLINMSNGSTTDIRSETGKSLKLLGFIGEDLIFGRQNITETIPSAVGISYTPMSSISIYGSNGQEKKTYEKPASYISDVKIQGSTIDFKLIQTSPRGRGYIITGSDQIMSSKSEGGSSSKLIHVAIEQRENIAEIQLAGEIPVSKLQLLTPDFALFEGSRSVDINSTDSAQNSQYTVYAKGSIEGIYSDPSDALAAASESSGIVVNAKNSYIWRKGSRSPRNMLTDLTELSGGSAETALSDCLDAMLSYAGSAIQSAPLLGQGDASDHILKSGVNGDVLPLMNVELQDVLYYVSSGSPVIAAGENGPVLIVGYDSKNILVYDPAAGNTSYKGMNDSTALFASLGNEYLTYTED